MYFSTVILFWISTFILCTSYFAETKPSCDCELRKVQFKVEKSGNEHITILPESVILDQCYGFDKNCGVVEFDSTYKNFTTEDGDVIETEECIPPQDQPENNDQELQQMLLRTINELPRHKNHIGCALAMIFILVLVIIIVAVKLNQKDPVPVISPNSTINTILGAENLNETYNTQVLTSVQMTTIQSTTTTEETEHVTEPPHTPKPPTDLKSSSPTCPRDGCPITEKDFVCYQKTKAEFEKQKMEFNEHVKKGCDLPLKYSMPIVNFFLNESKSIISVNDTVLYNAVILNQGGYTITLKNDVKKDVNMMTCDGVCCCGGKSRCEQAKSEEKNISFCIKDHAVAGYLCRLLVLVTYRQITECACNET